MDKKIKYSKEGLERGIEAAENNIKTFKEAIKKEKAFIEQFEYMLDAIDRKEKERRKMREVADANRS
ncbi:MAG: hypothetical protein GWN94_13980 [Phycisphaerae bacterium]|nr:hypothetical protein [Phycisphaerae bacterium]